ncbi:MAG: hypothetical protein NTZ83_03430 [Candidatus Pacearchaeota archaeon]|nr:hypothetical protein [Candidatus Pacearchaeota archaeon]
MNYKKINYKNIIKKLECENIPDTRKLQEIRLNSIGKISGDEEIMKEHYPEEYNIPRIITMSEEEVREVYSLALPLTFPLCDPFGYGNGCEIHFFRWYGNHDGAIHLTTQKNLNRLIKLFSKNNINIQVEESFGRILDAGRADPPGIVVPHSWYREGYDVGKFLLKHQFVVFDESINACPYFYIKKEISHSQEEDKYKTSSITITNKTKKSIELNCSGTFYMPKYYKPEDFLPELLKKYEGNLKKGHSNWRESQKKDKEISHSLELKLLSIGNPIEIYNPNWLGN